VGPKLVYRFEDRAVELLVVAHERRVTDGLSNVTLPETRRPQQTHRVVRTRQLLAPLKGKRHPEHHYRGVR